MKLNVETSVSRCEAGNFDARVTLSFEGVGSGYGKEALVGPLGAAFDGARKTVIQTIEAETKGRKS